MKIAAKKHKIKYKMDLKPHIIFKILFFDIKQIIFRDYRHKKT
jgi:hypothetical protein